jgi:hypothetical protein
VFTYTGPSASEVRAHISAGTGISVTDGVISSTITQYSDSNARSAISVTDSGGDGSLSYSSSTGVITYTGPSAEEVRAHISAGTGIDIASGSISVDTDVIATKTYVDEVAQGLKSKPSVRAATTTNLSANYYNGAANDGVGATLTADTNRAFTTLDGVTGWSVTTNLMGVLVKNQTAGLQNGRYNLTTLGSASEPWVLTRCSLCDESDEIPGAYTFVQSGTTQAGTGWVQTVVDTTTFTMGVDTIIVTQFSNTGGGINEVVEDTTPQLGGNLDVNGNSIVSTSNGNIVLEPNGTGDIFLNADRVRVGDVDSAVFITTNGTGSLIINTNSGTNSGNITIAAGANTNISITPNGTGQTVIKNLEYQEFVHSLGTGFAGTLTPNAANGNIQTVTLAGNLTINGFTSPVSGQTITLIITTGGTGRTLTSSMLFAGGSKTLSTTSTVDILTMSYIGTTYYASLVKGYA